MAIDPVSYGNAAAAVVEAAMGRPKDASDEFCHAVTANAAGYLAVKRVEGPGSDAGRRMSRNLVRDVRAAVAQPVTRDQAKDIVRPLVRMARAMVDRHWPAIEATAGRLAAEGAGYSHDQDVAVAREEQARRRAGGN